ncbi:transposase, partial [Thiocystis minor]|uniref:transposase n=1 Tax=Thiocystis minor TaxID=61597 RepID=UPI00191192F0
TLSLPVWLRAPEVSGPGWLHAVRLPPEAAEAARRRCRKTAQRQGRTPSDATLFLAGWVMVFTTVPPETLDGPTVLALYRCRWQVELAFKRLQSLLDLDILRTQRNSRLGEVWIRGKLLYALVIERRAQRHAAGGIDPLDRPRRLTPWRLLIIVRQEVDRWILEVQRWRDEHWDACLDVLKERPRRRRLQTVPARVMQMMNSQVSQRFG